jgi:hypothetical protein
LHRVAISLAVALAVGAVASLAGVARADSISDPLLANGSFEDGLNGWESSGNLAVLSGQGETDGFYALAFSFGDLPSNGVLWQDIQTEEGVTYVIDFDFGKYAVEPSTGVARLRLDVLDVIGGGSFSQTFSDATTGDGTSDFSSVYDSHRFTFVATGGITRLSFADLSDAQGLGGSFDAMLDNVSATAAVPEPGTIGLLALGVSALALRLRRRKTSARPRET